MAVMEDRADLMAPQLNVVMESLGNGTRVQAPGGGVGWEREDPSARADQRAAGSPGGPEHGRAAQPQVGPQVVEVDGPGDAEVIGEEPYAQGRRVALRRPKAGAEDRGAKARARLARAVANREREAP